MAISDETLVQIAERNEELEARHAVLYDALDHARRIAKKALLPDADHDEALRRVVDVALAAKTLCDSLANAGFVRGMEIVDEEITDLAKAAGGFHCLTPEGKVRYVAARKRASAREAKSLREHGTDMLRIHADRPVVADDDPEDDDGGNEFHPLANRECKCCHGTGTFWEDVAGDGRGRMQVTCDCMPLTEDDNA